MVDVKAVSAVIEETRLDSETQEYLLGSLADCETEEEAMDVRRRAFISPPLFSIVALFT